jgi:hypothetical protein
MTISREVAAEAMGCPTDVVRRPPQEVGLVSDTVNVRR